MGFNSYNIRLLHVIYYSTKYLFHAVKFHFERGIMSHSITYRRRGHIFLLISTADIYAFSFKAHALIAIATRHI